MVEKPFAFEISHVPLPRIRQWRPTNQIGLAGAREQRDKTRACCQRGGIRRSRRPGGSALWSQLPAPASRAWAC